MLFLLFSFRGRINRSQYWFGTLLVTFGNFAGQVLIQVLSANSAAAAKTLAEKLGAYAGASALLLPLSIAAFWASLAVQWKRFHDRGRPGWLSLIPLFVMIMMITSVVTDVMGGVEPMVILNNVLPYFWIIVLMGLAMFVDLGCLPSQDEPNKYGDPPGAPGARGPQPNPGAPQPGGLVNAQAAMDRAIAQRDAAPGVVKTTAPARGPAPSAPQPATGGAPSFGRRAAR